MSCPSLCRPSGVASSAGRRRRRVRAVAIRHAQAQALAVRKFLQHDAITQRDDGYEARLDVSPMPQPHLPTTAEVTPAGAAEARPCPAGEPRPMASDMAADDSVATFLEAFRAGYGAKWGPVFVDFGLELVEDLREALPGELSQLEDRLAAAGASPVHIRKMRQALSALRGEEAEGAPAATPATTGRPLAASPVAPPPAAPPRAPERAPDPYEGVSPELAAILRRRAELLEQPQPSRLTTLSPADLPGVGPPPAHAPPFFVERSLPPPPPYDEAEGGSDSTVDSTEFAYLRSLGARIPHRAGPSFEDRPGGVPQLAERQGADPEAGGVPQLAHSQGANPEASEEEGDLRPPHAELWDPACLTADCCSDNLAGSQQAELKHGCVSMLATMDSSTPAPADKLIGTDAPLGVAQGSDLTIGETVEIFGLSGAKELNGRRGTIVTFVKDRQRVGVRLVGDEETKAVKPANVKRLEASRPQPIAKVYVTGWAHILAYHASCDLCQDHSAGRRFAVGKELAAEIACGRLALMAITRFFFQDGSREARASEANQRIADAIAAQGGIEAARAAIEAQYAAAGLPPPRLARR